MFDLGDDFIVGSNRVPWLIWIQLIVMLLLLILLFCNLGALSFDLDLSSKPGPSLSPSLLAFNLGSFAADQYSSPLASIKLVENKSIPIVKCEVRTGTRGIIAAIGGRENVEEKELGGSASNFSYHPCHYIGLARRAFLKCLGLDSKSTTHSNQEHSKEE